MYANNCCDNIAHKVEEEVLSNAVNDTASFIVEKAEQLVKDVATKLEDTAEGIAETMMPIKSNQTVSNSVKFTEETKKERPAFKSTNTKKPTKTIHILGKKFTMDENKNATLTVIGTVAIAAVVTGIAFFATH